MSEFYTTINDDNIECPYCGHEHSFDDENFNEDQVITTCDSCEKNFYSYQCVMVDHRSEPDCELNSEAHDYQNINLGNGDIHRFCTVCDKCEPITKDYK